jgi:nucleoside-diphosphate-sugar epimerase
MRAVVTGAGGYAGPVVIETLLAADPENRVVAVTRDPRGLLALFAGADAGRIVAVTPDEFLRLDDDRLGADGVVHLAAGERGDPGALARAFRFTQRIIDWCLARGVRRLVCASSQAVYGVAPAPVTLYGGYKYAVETILERLRAGQSPALQAVSLRFGKLVGPSRRFRISSSEWPHVLAHAVVTGRTVTLPAEGTQQLDVVDVRDAAAAVVAALNHGGASLPPAINVGSGRPMTVRDIATMVSTIAVANGLAPLKCVLQPRGPAPLRPFAMANDLARQSLGFQARIPLEQTIRDLLVLPALVREGFRS